MADRVGTCEQINAVACLARKKQKTKNKKTKKQKLERERNNQKERLFLS